MGYKSKAKLNPDEIWDRYCQGYSFNEIGAEAGITGDMIRKRIKSNPDYEKGRQGRLRNIYKSEEIKKLISAGKSKKEIGEILGLSRAKITLVFHQDQELNQFHQSEGNPKISQAIQDRELIWNLHYSQGLTYAQIGEKLGRSVTYVRGKIRGNPKYRTKDQRREDKQTMIRFLLLSGLELDDIAKQLGLSCRAIKRALKCTN